MFEKVRIHISEIIPQTYFPVFVRVRIQAPHVFTRKLIPQENFPACIGFVPGGTRKGRQTKTFVTRYFLGWFELVVSVQSALARQFLNLQSHAVVSCKSQLDTFRFGTQTPKSQVFFFRCLNHSISNRGVFKTQTQQNCNGKFR